METWALWNIGLASLAGAAGVALAAVAAHHTSEPSLTTAALMLIMHAAAAVALSAAAGGMPVPWRLLASASLMIAAVVLFSGDVAARTLGSGRLFPMAAPLGGSLMILAWLGAGLSALVAALRGV